MSANALRIASTSLAAPASLLAAHGRPPRPRPMVQQHIFGNADAA